MTRDLQGARRAAEAAARAGAAVLRHYAADRDRLTLRDKGINELVSEADVEAQRVIVAALDGVVPGARFLGEEDDLGVARATEGPRWIIDPLDGTTNFLHGIPPYAVSIGLVEGTEGLVGVVYDLPHDELHSAAKGHGHTVNGEAASVSATDDLRDALVATGFPYRSFGHVDAYLTAMRRVMAGVRGLRRHGAASIDLAWVACGRFDAFFETGLSPWDVAAGMVLVEEGGGRFTAISDAVDALFGGQVLATNSLLHGPLHHTLEALHDVTA